MTGCGERDNTHDLVGVDELAMNRVFRCIDFDDTLAFFQRGDHSSNSE